MALNFWQKVSVVIVVTLLTFYICAFLSYRGWVKKRLIAENYKILNIDGPRFNWGIIRALKYRTIIWEVNATVIWNGMPGRKANINDGFYISRNGMEHYYE